MQIKKYGVDELRPIIDEILNETELDIYPVSKHKVKVQGLDLCPFEFELIGNYVVLTLLLPTIIDNNYSRYNISKPYLESFMFNPPNVNMQVFKKAKYVVTLREFKHYFSSDDNLKKLLRRVETDIKKYGIVNSKLKGTRIDLKVPDNKDRKETLREKMRKYLKRIKRSYKKWLLQS